MRPGNRGFRRALARAERITRNLPEEGAPMGGSFLEWVGVGLFGVLLACVLAGIWMVLVHGVPLPLDAVCLRG